jgi:hypothetical protein
MSEFPWAEADAMYLLLLRQAADLRCHGSASDDDQLNRVSRAVEAYEVKRWQAKKAAAFRHGLNKYSFWK